jgi:hypothetical protein
MNSFVVLWKPGPRNLYWYTGLDFDDFKQKSHDLHVQGYRIVSLDLDEGKFTAIWKPGTYGQYWERVDSSDIKSRITHYESLDYRMVYIAHDNGQVTMVWEPGHDAHYFCYGEDINTFKLLDQQHFAAGLHLRWIGLDEPGFSAIWRPGTGAQHWYYTTTFNDFISKTNSFKQQGQTMTCVDKAHEPGHYGGVVKAGTGDEHVDFMSYESISETDKQMAKRGLELSVIRRLTYNDGGLFPDLDGFEK